MTSLCLASCWSLLLSVLVRQPGRLFPNKLGSVFVFCFLPAECFSSVALLCTCNWLIFILVLNRWRFHWVWRKSIMHYWFIKFVEDMAISWSLWKFHIYLLKYGKIKVKQNKNTTKAPIDSSSCVVWAKSLQISSPLPHIPKSALSATMCMDKDDSWKTIRKWT